MNQDIFASLSAPETMGALLIVVIVLLIAIIFKFSFRGRQATPDADLETKLAEAESRAENSQAQLNAANAKNAGLQATLKAAEEQRAEDNARHKDQYEKMRSEDTARHEKALGALNEKLIDAETKLAEAIRQLNESRLENGKIDSKFASLLEKHQHLRAEIDNGREQLVNQFKAISQNVLESQGKQTTDQQKAQLELLINPFKTQLEGMRDGLKEITDRAEIERKNLGLQIGLMQQQAASLAEEAKSLTTALRGSSKAQGNWGELVLERLLEAAGMQEGTHFTREEHTRMEDGRALRPDVVVMFPGERRVIIDSKVTLTAYHDLINAADKEAERAALQRHVAAVRAHIRSLSSKNYAGIDASGIDSVLMFLPVENALIAALSQDESLITEALERGVTLITPTTLLPVLKVVMHLWTVDTRNRMVDAIVDRAGKLHDKFVSVVENIQAIGVALNRAQDAHSKAMSQMSAGQGNVMRQVDQLRDLGARTGKRLPAVLIGLDEDRDDQLADVALIGGSMAAPESPKGSSK